MGLRRSKFTQCHYEEVQIDIHVFLVLILGRRQHSSIGLFQLHVITAVSYMHRKYILIEFQMEDECFRCNEFI